MLYNYGAREGEDKKPILVSKNGLEADKALHEGGGEQKGKSDFKIDINNSFRSRWRGGGITGRKHEGMWGGSRLIKPPMS